MSFLEFSQLFFFACLATAMLLGLIRLLRGPTAADRFVALDLIGLLSATLFAGHAVAYESPSSIDIVLVLSIVLFFATAAFATLLYRSKRDE